jgi:hypothetical protein
MDWKEVYKEEFDKFIQKLLHHPESKEKMSQYTEWDYKLKRIVTWDSIPIAEYWDTWGFGEDKNKRHYRIDRNTYEYEGGILE